jgi:hypothetical protein
MTTTTDIKRQINEVLNSNQTTTGSTVTDKSGTDSSTVTSAEGRDPLMDSMTREAAIQNMIKSGAGALTYGQEQAAKRGPGFSWDQGKANELQRENVMQLLNR